VAEIIQPWRSITVPTISGMHFPIGLTGDKPSCVSSVSVAIPRDGIMPRLEHEMLHFVKDALWAIIPGLDELAIWIGAIFSKKIMLFNGLAKQLDGLGAVAPRNRLSPLERR
jgi:hypothetical protein